MNKKSIFLSIIFSLLSGYFIAFFQFGGNVYQQSEIKGDDELQQCYKEFQLPKETNNKLASQPDLTVPFFVRKSLLHYGFSLENMTASDWQKFLELASYDHLVQVSSLELLLYFSIVSENETLLDYALEHGADVDSRISLRKYSTPLEYTSFYSNLPLFKKVVDASKNLNLAIYNLLILKIHRGFQPDVVKQAKLDYLIASGYEISDILKELIPLSSYGSLIEDYSLKDGLANVNPNEVRGESIMLTRMVMNGASDELVEPLVYQLRQDLENSHKEGLLWSALNSKSIKKGDTIQAILNTGLDPNMKLSSDRRFSFAGYALVQAIVTNDLDKYNNLMVKFRVLVDNGASIIGQHKSKQIFIEKLKRNTHITTDRYEELLSIIEKSQ